MTQEMLGIKWRYPTIGLQRYYSTPTASVSSCPEYPRVHILRAWHHSAVQLSWPPVLHCIQKRLPFLKGKTRLFAILKPLASLRKLFRRHARTALRMN